MNLNSYNPVPGVMENVPSSRNYEGGFACELMLKDLKIATEAAKQAGAQVPFGEASKRIYENLVKDGKNRKDFGVVFQEYKNNAIKTQ